VGEEPTATTDAGAGAAVSVEVGRWSRSGILSSTLEEPYCHTRFLRPKPDAHRMYAQDQVVIHTVRM
jgi:hypothetical protein